MTVAVIDSTYSQFNGVKLMLGENTGKLPMMMGYVADYYENLHTNLVKRINTFIEPILIVFIAIIVGVVVISVIIPMFDFYGAVL